LGEKSIKWESAGMFSDKLQRITYEEVINDADTSTRPIQTKKVLGSEWEQEHLNEGRYTLNMVRIDHKVREVIHHIKMEEAKKAHLQNKVDDAAPKFL
jgi:hypothetical protein